MHKNISYKLDSMMKSKIGIDFFIILFYFKYINCIHDKNKISNTRNQHADENQMTAGSQN